MGLEKDSVLLTESQAACLETLKNENKSKTKIAITAELDLKRTSHALKGLEDARLVERDNAKQWRITQLGRNISYETKPNRRLRNDEQPGPGAQRLLKELDRPMHSANLVGRLGITRQRIHQLAVELHALGYVRFGDQGSRFSLIARKDDPTELLTRDEERILSTVSDQFSTNTAKIRSAARLSAERAIAALERLVALGLFEEIKGPSGERLYGIQSAGLLHPQYDKFAKRAETPPLPVKSDRVFSVLSRISANGQVRIKDVSQALRLSHASINALFQYLKRKSLVRKSGLEFDAPYELTDEGHQVLVELTHRQAA